MRAMRAGFSMVEAVVALAIAAVGLTAILELQQQIAINQARHERALARMAMRQNSLVIIRDLNPEASPDGELKIDESQILNWTSTPVSPLRRSIGLPAGDAGFNVRLYEVSVTVTDKRSNLTDRFTVERLGWKALPRASYE